MNRFITYLSLCVLILVPISFFVLQPAPYDGQLGEDDVDVRGITSMIASGQNLPEEFRLRYSGVRHDIYLSFYDRRGKEVWYKFREDRWDDRPLKKISLLVQGQAYALKGKLLGIRNGSSILSPTDPNFKATLDSSDSRLVFQFDSFRALSLEQILL